MTAACARCTTPTDATLCWTCTHDVTRDLEALAGLLPHLTTTAAGLTANAGRTGTIGRTGHAPGVHVHAFDAAEEVRTVVVGWLAVLTESRTIDPDHLPPRAASRTLDTARLCTHLAAHMTRARTHEAAADIAADVLDPTSWLWRGELHTRAPLLRFVTATVDTHRGGDGLPLDVQVRAAAAADEWWPIADVMAVLPRLLPVGVRPPSRRAVQRWAYGERQKGRAPLLPVLLVDAGTVRVGSVVDLALGDSQASGVA